MIHIQLRDDKVWIHEDLTGVGIAKNLKEKGILAEDIVLGFVEPALRAERELVAA